MLRADVYDVPSNLMAASRIRARFSDADSSRTALR